jgi:metal-dependent amidase/aminoacylase/carboxypeptidase family protein
MQASLIKEAMDIKDQLVDWRRDFHRHPESGAYSSNESCRNRCGRAS